MALSHIAVFPNETFSTIISSIPHTDTSTLCSLARCSRTFALSAEPRLYSSLRFTAGSKSIRLARTLLRNYRKSLLVSTIVADIVGVELALLPAGLKLIAGAIIRCLNLNSLSIALRPSLQWASAYLLFSKFQLSKFVSWFQWDQTVCWFLELQPSLQVLEIVRPGPESNPVFNSQPKLSTNALPKLMSFMGRLPQALLIIPGRPIETLTLYGAVSPTNLESALPVLAQSSAQIESLSLQVGELSPELWALISAYLPNLSRLELRIVRYSTVALSNLTSESLGRAMSLMSRLKHYRVRLRCPQLFRGLWFDTQREVVLDWKFYCASLQKVIFESSSENITSEWNFDEEAMDWVCSLDE